MQDCQSHAKTWTTSIATSTKEIVSITIETSATLGTSSASLVVIQAFEALFFYFFFTESIVGLHHRVEKA